MPYGPGPATHTQNLLSAGNQDFVIQVSLPCERLRNAHGGYNMNGWPFGFCSFSQLMLSFLNES